MENPCVYRTPLEIIFWLNIKSPDHCGHVSDSVKSTSRNTLCIIVYLKKIQFQGCNIVICCISIKAEHAGNAVD